MFRLFAIALLSSFSVLAAGEELCSPLVRNLRLDLTPVSVERGDLRVSATGSSECQIDGSVLRGVLECRAVWSTGESLECDLAEGFRVTVEETGFPTAAIRWAVPKEGASLLDGVLARRHIGEDQLIQLPVQNSHFFIGDSRITLSPKGDRVQMRLETLGRPRLLSCGAVTLRSGRLLCGERPVDVH